jgi:hypothetical protein
MAEERRGRGTEGRVLLTLPGLASRGRTGSPADD